MKITFLTLLLWLVLVKDGAGQPLLKQAEKYPLGAMLDFTMADTTNVSPSPAGANVTWNFSSLSPLPTPLRKQALLPQQTDYAADFPTAGWALKDSEGSINYYKENGDSLWLVGFVETNSDIKIIYTEPPLYFTRNLTYTGQAQGNTRYHYSYSTYNYNGGGTYSLTADGYGTLVLPTGTYNKVMRVKFEGNYFDTLQGPGSYVQTTKMVNYNWYNAYNSAPLLSIDSFAISSPFVNETQRSVSYAQNPINAVKSVNAEQPVISLRDNRLQVTHLNDALYRVNLYDLAGRELFKGIMAAENNTGEVTLPETVSPGCYIIQIENGPETLQQKLVIL